MDRRGHRQRELPFASAGQWERLPTANQERCRKLVSQLLREVIIAESAMRREKDE